MTPAEVEALRLDLLLVHEPRFQEWKKRRPILGEPPAPLSPVELDGAGELGAELDAMHEDNVRRHGATRANLARWTALLRLCDFLRRSEHRRKERALLEATEALERARLAELGEARWLRVAVWLARRVDDAAQRMGRRTKIVTRIDFSPAPELADYGEAIEPEDIEQEDGEIPW